MNDPDGLSTDRHRVNMAFSIEEAPCGSTGLLHIGFVPEKTSFSYSIAALPVNRKMAG
jgi:hypothetical protein